MKTFEEYLDGVSRQNKYDNWKDMFYILSSTKMGYHQILPIIKLAAKRHSDSLVKEAIKPVATPITREALIERGFEAYPHSNELSFVYGSSDKDHIFVNFRIVENDIETTAFQYKGRFCNAITFAGCKTMQDIEQLIKLFIS